MTMATGREGTLDISAPSDENQSQPVSLALDLINTEVMHRGKRRDLLMSPDDLAKWWGEVCERSPDECAVEGASEPIAWTSELLDATKALRTGLRTILAHVVARQAVEEEDLTPLNAILALGYSALERTRHGSVKAVTYLRDPEQGSILFPVALSALRLFTETDWQRLHECQSDRCIIFFYDTTKSSTRRWCSQGCRNRDRSIQHYQQTKKQAPS